VTLKTRRNRILLIASLVVVAAAVATLHAQRGYGGYRNSYSGNVRYDGRFVFVRVSYPWYGGRGAPWAHDYPRGEEHFLKILNEITSTPTHVSESSIVSLSDPEMFKFPVIYMCEPGYWSMSDAETTNLRAYLQKGGFLIFDDFRGRDWANVDLQFSRVFPEAKWVDLDQNHPIFHSFFEINSLDIIPQAYDQGRPIFRALFEDNDPTKRVMVIAAYNTDISEFWEWSDTGYAPIDVTNEAYKLGVNLFMYGITH
jgi:hypothetical protein